MYEYLLGNRYAHSAFAADYVITDGLHRETAVDFFR
jgi:hypothetical protein